MCKIAIISWPIHTKTPFDFYLNLGEIYDSSVKNDISKLSELNRDLKYLYPFRFINGKCDNVEDFNIFKDKYKLTLSTKIFRKETENENNDVIFRTPILYDISCMVPLFEKSIIKINSEYISNPIICIVLHNIDPISRGKILEEVISNKPRYIILTGDVNGSNTNSTAGLMYRYIRKNKVPLENIFKLPIGKKPDCILEAIALLDVLNIPENYKIVIACSQEDIGVTQNVVRFWRRKKIINKNISYYCPYY